MDLNQLANLGEFVGGVAVLVTLIYLVIQIRQNNANARASSRQALLTGLHSGNFEVAKDAEMMRIIGAGLGDFDSLTPVERARFVFTLDHYIGNVENGLLLYQQGILDRTTLDGVAGALAISLNCPGGATYWQRMPAPPEVRAYVDAFLEANAGSLPSFDDIMPGWVTPSPRPAPEH